MLDFLRSLQRFATYVTARFLRDRCMQMAASLTFTSLLALVPLLAVSLAAVSAFPVFEGMREELQHFLFENFLPHFGEVVEQWIAHFLGNTNQLTTFGVAGLAITAIMMLATIEEAFNQIWHVDRVRGLALRVLRFWTALTLGPILLALGITLPGYLFAAVRFTGAPDPMHWLSGAAIFLPALIELVGFTLLYLLLPNRHVRLRHAFAGGMLAMLLFELLKFGFALYVISFPTYETLYGALAALPFLLLWVWLAWLVVLVGAEVAASLPAWRHAAAATERGSPALRIDLALDLLIRLGAAFRHGRGVSDRRLHEHVQATPADIDEMLRLLARAGFIVSHDDGWRLGRDLNSTTLHDLFQALGLAMDEHRVEGVGWRQRLNGLLDTVERLEQNALGVTLADLFTGGERPDPPQST